ncbi:RNA polymerase sigma factor [Polymorphospora rubra]|uniref:RNA polymerase sigma factor 70 region 4 type 2 domain-containing protein n=1 Tax=Polymorphospora rubra TaxID=338584 RepID=A0A810MYP1_9ACTN|nr:sigma-70 region 4 domain-containing protein [Polymorphospora rubra]BCJ65079.1 hypothetical protein Prubr_21000 [Polymorphospora rubra]
MTVMAMPSGYRNSSLFRQVSEALGHLTVTQQQVLVMYGIEGRSLKDTARQLGLAAGTVKGIFTGACQRLSQVGATAPAILSAPTVAEVTVGAALAANIHPQPAACPDWCTFQNCTPDKGDGSTYHMSAHRVIEIDRPGGGHAPGVGISRLVEEDGSAANWIDVSVGDHCGTGMTSAQALELAAYLREDALRAAGADGVDMPAGRLQVGDQIRTADGWQTVEVVHLDGWCCGIPMKADHVGDHRVSVCTDAHDDDNDAHLFDSDEVVRVRQAVRR